MKTEKEILDKVDELVSMHEKLMRQGYCDMRYIDKIHILKWVLGASNE